MSIDSGTTEGNKKQCLIINHFDEFMCDGGTEKLLLPWREISLERVISQGNHQVLQNDVGPQKSKGYKSTVI